MLQLQRYDDRKEIEREDTIHDRERRNKNQSSVRVGGWGESAEIIDDKGGWRDDKKRRENEDVDFEQKYMR